MNQNNIYFYSIQCPAIIYLDNANFNGRINNIHKPPYFIQQYAVNINQEALLSSTALLKVEAISPNSNNSLNMVYSITEDFANSFSIDPIDGFIYIKQDFGLEPKAYTLKVIYL